MARRWVPYELPVMVRVDVDDDADHAEVSMVVLGVDHDDVHLARDHRGRFLVYDERMERVSDDLDRAAARALTTAEDRAAWPTRDGTFDGALDGRSWEQGPDALRYPDLYDDDNDSPEGDVDDDYKDDL